MASISCDKTTDKKTGKPVTRIRIIFKSAQGDRKAIRLGRVSKKMAGEIKTHVESIVSAQIMGLSIPMADALWLKALGPELRNKLSLAGLCPKKQGSTKLGAFLDQYIADRPNTKPNTIKGWKSGARNLKAFFGEDKDIRTITVAAAGAFERYLESSARNDRGKKGKNDTTLALATVRKRVSLAKQFFAEAVDDELIEKSPFHKLKGNTVANPARVSYVDLDKTAKVLAACPTAEWRLIVALCRFGGLRCPSEVLGLKIDDVKWEQNRIIIRSPKTEHHEGKEQRLIPIFPELVQPLLDVADAAEPGTEYFITRYREATQNLRTTFLKIIEKAGVKPWPKLFQNMRSTRQTELQQHEPEYVVCAWLGNSPPVAQRHYLQVTDEHFERAARNPARTIAASDKLPQTVS